MSLQHLRLNEATDSDGSLRRALEDAHLPSLLPAVAQLTGDRRLLDPSFRPSFEPVVEGVLPQGGMGEAAQREARERLLEALRGFRDGAAPTGDPIEPLELMTFITGPVDEGWLPLMRHELGTPEDVGAPTWHREEIAPDRPFTVVVVGAGISGIAATHRFAQAGLDVITIEKNPDIGGTWYENRYPGCRLDTSNFAYSYSFAQKPDWVGHFSTAEEIHAYLDDTVDRLDLRRHIRFDTEVKACRFDESVNRWEVEVATADGATEVIDADAIVTAVGQLNRPKFPNIKGIDTFAGQTVHSAQWNDGVEVDGRRVAVIGTGASAFQIIPSIADRVEQMVVFQRTPPWLIPTPDYHEPLPEGQRTLLGLVPTYGRWFRFYQFWFSVEGRLPFVRADPSWDEPGSVSERNARLRAALETHLKRQFADRPDLLAKVRPTYPPGSKRMVRDNGVYPAALKQEHVHLEVTGIERIEPEGVRTTDGVLHEVDLIVFATGFQASDFLTPMRVTGLGGIDLHDQWSGDARAYLGIHVPGFPNLFTIYGPNTGLVINGSIVLFSELATWHIHELIRLLLKRGQHTITARKEVFDRFNAEVDAANEGYAWGQADVNSWYKNALGRVSQVWPFSLMDYWNATRVPRPEEYEWR